MVEGPRPCAWDEPPRSVSPPPTCANWTVMGGLEVVMGGGRRGMSQSHSMGEKVGMHGTRDE